MMSDGLTETLSSTIFMRGNRLISTASTYNERGHIDTADWNCEEKKMRQPGHWTSL
jgi:hypothetical protein